MTTEKTLTERLGFEITDEAGPLTPEMWEWLQNHARGKPSRGVARRLRVIASDLRGIGDAWDGDGSTAVRDALRLHAEELLEVADWLSHDR